MCRFNFTDYSCDCFTYYLINNILNAREEVYFMQDFIEILFPHKAKSE